jgi:arylsulfatase
LSNTPFRLYKRWTHEGGISTPLIVHWPAGGLNNGAIVRAPFQLTDLLPTILEATQVSLPEHGSNPDIPNGEGCSFLPVMRGGKPTDHTLYWEHTGNAAVRRGRWKLVREYPKPWELYDMDTDRAEKTDLALSNPDVVRKLVAQWEAWADRVGVVPWDDVLAGYRAEGKSEADAAG